MSYDGQRILAILRSINKCFNTTLHRGALQTNAKSADVDSISVTLRIHKTNISKSKNYGIRMGIRHLNGILIQVSQIP